MHDTYIPNQKFDSNRISVIRYIIKIRKIWTIVQILWTSIFLYTKHAKPKPYRILIVTKMINKIVKKKLSNNQVTYLIFISNEFIDFSESIFIFSIFFYFFVKTYDCNRETVSSIILENVWMSYGILLQKHIKIAMLR